MSDLFLLVYHHGILLILLMDTQAINIDEEETEEYLQQSFCFVGQEH